MFRGRKAPAPWADDVSINNHTQGITMNNKFAVSFSLIASLVVGSAAHAQASDAGSCDKVQWKADVIAKHPDIAKSCVGIVERDGKKYVKISGKVASKGKDSITVKLDNAHSMMTWKPAPGETVSIEGKDVPAMSVAVDQALRFYMPIAQVSN
jgi:hypothetical protein